MFRVLNGMCFAFSVYQVPEDDEVFSVRLTGVAGGALLKPNASSVRLRILRNDSPLRFSHTFMAVPESAAVIALNVTRGRLTEDGPLIGSVDTEVVFFKPSFHVYIVFYCKSTHIHTINNLYVEKTKSICLICMKHLDSTVFRFL